MKEALVYLFIVLSLSGCNISTATDRKMGKEPSNGNAANVAGVFTLPDAEKILGEKAHLKDSSSTIDGKAVQYQCAYAANSKDDKTQKTGIIYFMFEEYCQVTSALDAYSSIKRANEGHEGIKTLEGIGDEAYFHSDGDNFYFILARKGRKMIRMKVNKITSTTSLDAFNSVTKKIVDAI